MEFFNKKEEVLEIKLTPYGKYKLSLGNLSPEYYSFFDGDILYDYAYSAVTGSRTQLVETQNDIEDRILEETPSIKPFKMRTGISSSQTPGDQALRDAIETFDTTWDITPLYVVPAGLYTSASLAFQSDNFLRRPLGTSRLTSPYYPAWETLMYQGRITSSATTYYGTLTSPGVTASIPQIDIVYNCRYYVSQIQGYEEAEDTDYYFTQPTDANNLQALTTDIFTDGTYITVDRRDLVISVRENNADFFKENFDIEVFVSSADPCPPCRNIEWRKLVINDSPPGLVSGPQPSPTPDNVGYYLTLNVDREIDTALIDQLRLDNNIAFNSPLVGSDEVSTREYFIRDLYNPQEDICE